MANFAKLIGAVNKAQKDIERALAKEFPIGTTVRCYIMHGQVNPSIGQVISYPGGPYALIRVRLQSRKSKVRDISAWNLR